jgi:hypothetical protein
VGWLFVVLALVACGRGGYDQILPEEPEPEPEPEPGPVAHVDVAPGWTVRRLVDLSNHLPYLPGDFINGSPPEELETLDNAPSAVAALYPPFTASFAVSAGRSILEVNDDGQVAIHPYRPQVPDTEGPDSIVWLAFGEQEDTGPRLWFASASRGDGDGLYYVSPGTWEHFLDNNTNYNNVEAIAFDTDGAFDSTGKPSIYFAMQGGVHLRNVPEPPISREKMPDSREFRGLAVSTTALFVVKHEPMIGSELARIFAGTHDYQGFVTSASFTVPRAGRLRRPASL